MNRSARNLTGRIWHLLKAGVGMVDMKLQTSLVVVVAVGDSLAVFKSLCVVEVKHAVDVYCTHSHSGRDC